MPSHRKRIGFLPSEEVHEIIDKLCIANKYSQSNVTGLLVEEALRSRGVLNDPLDSNANKGNKATNNIILLINYHQTIIKLKLNYHKIKTKL